MCYATKRKIADCVKQLMKKKEIRRITIQDIMDATSMSRQSFYYHFKDIYDVLDWVTRHDFTDRIEGGEGQSIEDWAVHVIHVLDQERPFFERMVSQIEWPRLIAMISEPVEKQMSAFLCSRGYGVDAEMMEFCVKYAAGSYCYYMLDYIYHKKHKSDEQLHSEIHSLCHLMMNPTFLCTVEQSKMHARMVG